VWFKSLPVPVRIVKDGRKWRIRAYVDPIRNVQSRAFDTRREALQAIKSCGAK